MGNQVGRDIRVPESIAVITDDGIQGMIPGKLKQPAVFSPDLLSQMGQSKGQSEDRTGSVFVVIDRIGGDIYDRNCRKNSSNQGCLWSIGSYNQISLAIVY
jgi:hypothetical protein